MTPKKELQILKKELMRINKLMNKDRWGFWGKNINNWGNAKAYIFYDRYGNEYEINDETETFPKCCIQDIVYICKYLKISSNDRIYYDIFNKQFITQNRNY